MTKKTDPQVRFWKKVKIGQTHECWLWTGDKTYHGYGRFVPHPKRATSTTRKPSPRMAHRLAWEYFFGVPVPVGLECCHSCDNPACCNPAHLFIGRHADNMADMVKKGRSYKPKGELHGEAKLTQFKVAGIRSDYASGIHSQGELAKMHNVSKRLIQKIVRRQAWIHI